MRGKRAIPIGGARLVRCASLYLAGGVLKDLLRVENPCGFLLIKEPRNVEITAVSNESNKSRGRRPSEALRDLHHH